MKQKIGSYLEELEHKRNIKILLACETGSRAWGFPSPDSDYDVRMIYVHKKDWYLGIEEPKDTIELMFENKNIDIVGWELRKTLRLLKKSNAALLERIQSSIIYRADTMFTNDIKTIANECYSRIATIHHYLSMGKKIIVELSEQEEVKLKKLFYALRSIAVCNWILEFETIPPIDFTQLYPKLSLETSLQQNIKRLIELKKTVNESYLHNKNQEGAIFDYMNQSILRIESVKANLPTGNNQVDQLNLVLKKYINKYDY